MFLFPTTSRHLTYSFNVAIALYLKLKDEKVFIHCDSSVREKTRIIAKGFGSGSFIAEKNSSEPNIS